MMQPTLAWVLLTLTALTTPTPTASLVVEDVRKPRCSDQSIIIAEDLSDGYRGRCDCQFEGDKEGQLGANLYLSWYENRTCKYMSLTGEQLNCTSPETQSEEWLKEHFSYAEDQWLTCLVFPAVGAMESSDPNTYCTQILNSDGTVTEAIADCSIPKYYTGK